MAPPPPPAPPPPAGAPAASPGIDFTKAIAGVTALGAGLAVLAKSTGAFDLMQRNHPHWSAGVFSAAALAGVLVALAGLLPNRSPGELALFVTGLTLFLVSAVGAVVLLTFARGERPPPSVQVQLKAPPVPAAGAQPGAGTPSPSTVTGTVTAEQMTSGQTLRVAVVATTDEEPTLGAADVEDRLYQARVGADASGNVKLPFAFPVPTKYRWLKVAAWIDEVPEYCLKAGPQGILGATRKTPGCLIVRLPDAVS